MNREICQLMMQDKFSKMMHCNVRISKAPSIEFIDNFLSICAPAEATQKHVMLDQGGQLHGLPQMVKIFKKHDCTVLPTALDASNQNPMTPSNCCKLCPSSDDWCQPTSQILVMLFTACCANFELPAIARSNSASPIEMSTNEKEDQTQSELLALEFG